MLRNAAKRLLGAGQRCLSTSAARLEEAAAPAGPKEFAEAWAKKAPSTMGLPLLPSNFLKASATGDSKVNGDLFPVNFFTPHGILAEMAQVMLFDVCEHLRLRCLSLRCMCLIRDAGHGFDRTIESRKV